MDVNKNLENFAVDTGTTDEGQTYTIFECSYCLRQGQWIWSWWLKKDGDKIVSVNCGCKEKDE